MKIWQDKKSKDWNVTGIHQRFGKVTIKAGKTQPNPEKATELFNKEVIKLTKKSAPPKGKEDGDDKDKGPGGGKRKPGEKE